MSDLTTAEVAELADLECRVDAGLKTFIEVGEALLRIRDARLYRASHPTFEVYCRERWAMGRHKANRLVQAAEIAAVVPIGTIENEAQARELAPLRDDPEAMGEVLRLATEATDGKPTAAAIRTVMGTRGDTGENPFERRALRAFTELVGVLHGVQSSHEADAVIAEAGPEDRRRFVETLPSIIDYLSAVLTGLQQQGLRVVD